MRKTYSGKWKPKYPEKYHGDSTKITYRSLWERHTFRWIEKQPWVRWWNSEETIIPYICATDKRAHRYFIDLTIKRMDGKTILVEIKPDAQTKPPKRKNLNEALSYMKNTSKWKYAKKYCDDRGWKFEIWTENTLEGFGVPGMKRVKKAPWKPLKKKKKMTINK
mgnify:FL=1|jgi:hypothetical protein